MTSRSKRYEVEKAEIKTSRKLAKIKGRCQIRDGNFGYALISYSIHHAMLCFRFDEKEALFLIGSVLSLGGVFFLATPSVVLLKCITGCFDHTADRLEVFARRGRISLLMQLLHCLISCWMRRHPIHRSSGKS